MMNHYTIPGMAHKSALPSKKEKAHGVKNAGKHYAWVTV